MGNDHLNQKTLQWGCEKLVSLGFTLKNTAPEKVLETPWSKVSRFETSEGLIYLKSAPEQLALEPLIIDILQRRFHASVPSVLAHNAKLKAFLMKDAGRSLREILKERFDEALLCRAIDQFTSLQLKVAEQVDSLLNIGVPDYRLDKLPTLFMKLISQKELLKEEGLTDIEINTLESLLPKISTLCEKLSDYPVKQTMVQPDFNDNNTLVDDVTGGITMIDLGEIVISHPFFSLHNCLQQIKKHHALKADDAVFIRIKEACLNNFKDLFESETALADAFSVAGKLLNVYEVAFQDRFISACGKENLKSYQHWKLGALLKECVAAMNAVI